MLKENQTRRLSTARCALFPLPEGEGQGEGERGEVLSRATAVCLRNSRRSTEGFIDSSKDRQIDLWQTSRCLRGRQVRTATNQFSCPPNTLKNAKVLFYSLSQISSLDFDDGLAG